jgi:Xaa-Pro dipeptidase
VIEEGGFGPGYKYLTHRLGHGIGINGHERPYMMRGNATKLVAGMTFADEPGIYIPGELGIRHEDTLAVTENGYLRAVSPVRMIQVVRTQPVLPFGPVSGPRI